MIVALPNLRERFCLKEHVSSGYGYHWFPLNKVVKVTLFENPSVESYLSWHNPKFTNLGASPKDIAFIDT